MNSIRQLQRSARAALGRTGLLIVAPLIATLVASLAIAAPTRDQPSLTLEGARRAATAAIAFAKSRNAPGGAIAIVDAGGHTILLERLDGTFAAGADISIGKARTAVLFQRPTRGIEETINKGRSAMIPLSAVTDFTPLQGGVPIRVGGSIVGAIGVSGASSAQQDEEIALAGAQALESADAGSAAAGTSTGSAPSASVRRFDAAAVRAAFRDGETGATLIEQPAFRVNASRRDGPGQAEVHRFDTDVFYVLEGRASVITGGELVEPREIAPAEVRGFAIRGGTEHALGPGDVMTIPHGVPHWFRSVSTPFRYYVVKSVTGL